MDEHSWRWLKSRQLKKETEGLIITAQDEALQTDALKHNIDNLPRKNIKIDMIKSALRVH